MRRGALVELSQIHGTHPIDLYFGPDAPPGQHDRWNKTIPGRAGFTCVRIYWSTGAHRVNTSSKRDTSADPCRSRTAAFVAAALPHWPVEASGCWKTSSRGTPKTWAIWKAISSDGE